MFDNPYRLKSLFYRITVILCLALACFVGLSTCSGEDETAPVQKQKQANLAPSSAPPVPRETLPEDIEWITNQDDPVFASPDAKRGGILHDAMLSFPLTFRVVGPDSNSSLRGVILGNQLSLIAIHPNTRNIIPEIATHWAYGKDRRTMYFKLNPKARWSDGVPVTADDFAYTLTFMRSKYIVAPWYNDYYTKEIERVVVYDDHTLAVVSTKAQPDLHLKIAIAPTPRHFYGRLDDTFIQKYNWAIVPNTGAYQIDKFKKGRYIQFKRKKDWWGDEEHYFKHRFNVDKVLYKVIRDMDLQWEYFKKARLDFFSLLYPSYWHIKSKTKVVEQGYVNKMWFFNDTPQPSLGLYLNEDREIFKDPNVRHAFAYAMNTEKVLSDVLMNDYLRLESGYVGYGRYTNPDIKARRYDIGKVETLMHASGWKRGPDGIWTKGGQRFSAEVVYSAEDHTPRLVVLKEEAKKAGVELRLLKLDPSAAFKKVLEKKHDVAWMGWSTSMRPRFWEHYHSVNAHKPQTNNITNTDDPELDKMIDAYRNSLDENERIELAHRIQKKIYDIGAYVPTYMVPYFREAYWRWWRFPTPPATRSSGSLFEPFDSTTGGLFWFDEQRYKETREAMDKGITYDPVVIKDETYRP